MYDGAEKLYTGPDRALFEKGHCFLCFDGQADMIGQCHIELYIPCHRQDRAGGMN